MTVSELKNTKLKSNWISIPVFPLAICVILGQLLFQGLTSFAALDNLQRTFQLNHFMISLGFQ